VREYCSCEKYSAKILSAHGTYTSSEALHKQKSDLQDFFVQIVGTPERSDQRIVHWTRLTLPPPTPGSCRPSFITTAALFGSLCAAKYLACCVRPNIWLAVCSQMFGSRCVAKCLARSVRPNIWLAVSKQMFDSRYVTKCLTRGM
jgi:hypothetical protein